jgi:light-regulated signal transduction histidine kinase (bacteriophytochrome)
MIKKIEQINRELHQTIEKLQTQNQDLHDFCTIVAHDLHGSVCGIAQSAVWLQEQVAQSLDPDLEKRFDLLISKTLWMDTLITDLLTYSQMGQHERKYEPVSVAQLVNLTIDFLAPPPEISIKIAPNLPILLTERIPLQIVFTNLISNAIKHRLQPQGSIEISGSECGNFYEFSITDDGLGIALEHQQKIFEIFTTVPNQIGVAGSPNCQGIGLAIVKKAVERNGGKIWVESELGSGSTFRFTWVKNIPIP